VLPAALAPAGATGYVTGSLAGQLQFRDQVSSHLPVIIVVVKMLALGLGASILIDASVIRLLIVPATMFLLGRCNWWTPEWLDRLLPRLDPRAPPRRRPSRRPGLRYLSRRKMISAGDALSSASVAKGSQSRPGIDVSVPNIARMYDYWLGGKDNFAADRDAADRQARAIPQLPLLARENREFLRRAVRFLAGQGISQFLDIGSGLPTNENVHQVAQRVNPDARVVYADIDPVVVSHAQALLSGRGVAAVRGDVCRPEEILGAPEVRALIDFGQPVAVLMLAILHVIPDEADPGGAVARLREAMAPGSYLVISHADVSREHVAGTQRLSHAARELEEAVTALQRVPARTREEITGFFGDLTLVEPGLTDIWAWRPDSDTVTTTSEFMRILGAVARKD
jgi:hypothetical protein